MQDAVQQRMSLETGLRAAIDGDCFRVVYQPQHALKDGELVGAEALLRWHDPALGDVPPGRFIPAAEEAGLIVPINRIVMAKVLAQIALWRARGLDPPRISINVAAEQLREPGFEDELREQLERHAADCVQVSHRNDFLMRGDLKHAVGRRIHDGLASANVLRTESIDDFGARCHDVAQRAAADATFELGHPIRWKSLGKSRKRALEDDTHHFPMPGDRVLAGRSLRHASICSDG